MAIPIGITAGEIRRRRFQADAELRDAWSGAMLTTLRGEII
jgi:hypothetical protein